MHWEIVALIMRNLQLLMKCSVIKGILFTFFQFIGSSFTRNFKKDCGWKGLKYFLNRALAQLFQAWWKLCSQLFTAAFPVAFYCDMFFATYFIWLFCCFSFSFVFAGSLHCQQKNRIDFTSFSSSNVNSFQYMTCSNETRTMQFNGAQNQMLPLDRHVGCTLS